MHTDKFKVEDIIREHTACFTGHRPNKLYGYDRNSEGNRVIRKKLHDKIVDLIENHGINTFISGMALGIDMWAALAVIKLRTKYPHIRLVAAVPCLRQWSRWNPEDVIFWHRILEACDLVVMVTNEEYTPACMQMRNIWMVDHSDHVIAVYDGSPRGGTFNCIKYAKTKKTHIHTIDPRNAV